MARPKFLQSTSSLDVPLETETFQPPQEDPELRPEITTLATNAKPGVQKNLGTNRFLRFSRWANVVNAVLKLAMVAQHHHHAKASVGNETTVIQARKRAQLLIVRNLQIEAFEEEFDSLEKKKELSKTSPLLKLNPIIDSDGLLRIGGRLKRADFPYEVRHPLILPGKHHVTSLIVKNCHEEAKHQGRHFTHGMVRSKGFWIVGGKRLVNRDRHYNTGESGQQTFQISKWEIWSSSDARNRRETIGR